MIPSPCIGTCTLDETGLCAGCLRSGDEIAAWACASDDERLQILAALKERRRARGLTSEADGRPRRRARIQA